MRGLRERRSHGRGIVAAEAAGATATGRAAQAKARPTRASASPGKSTRQPAGDAGSSQWRASRPFVDGASIMGKIVRRVLDGYVTLIEWSPSDPATVEAAEMIFRREVEGGYVAVVEDDGVHSRPVRSLPVDAERVVMTTAMGGG